MGADVWRAYKITMAKQKQYIKYQAIVVLETELDDDSIITMAEESWSNDEIIGYAKEHGKGKIIHDKMFESMNSPNDIEFLG